MKARHHFLSIITTGVSGIAADRCMKGSLSLKPIPESSAHLLLRPADVEFDKNGRSYILDHEAPGVFVWERNGRLHHP